MHVSGLGRPIESKGLS